MSNQSSAADFGSCRAKLARSKEKLDALNAKVTAYVDDEPCRPESTTDPETGAPRFRARITKEPPDDWWLDVGEIGYHARSALDHLARQLAIDSGHAVTDKTRTQFPIFLDSDDYRRGGQRSYREKMLVGIASRHRKVIDEYQPYHRKRGQNDPLALLRAISDRDKHRDLHVAAAASRSVKVGPRYTVEGLENIVAFEAQTRPPAPPNLLADGEIFGPVLSANINGVDVYQEMWIEEPLPITVAFIGDDDVILTVEDLDRIVLHVAGVIDRFEARVTGKRP